MKTVLKKTTHQTKIESNESSSKVFIFLVSPFYVP